jgi:Domain of unknown function (DUF1998)
VKGGRKPGERSYPPRVGGVRPSQLLYSFGVGALVDLPNMSGIIAGLDDWEETNQIEIAEERLIKAIKADPSLGLPNVRSLRTAPFLEETRSPFDEWAWTGVPILPFPRWMRCQGCNTLTTVDGGLLELTLAFRADKARYVHKNCGKGRPPTAVPARFVVACPDGHIDDFPWNEYVHSKTGGVCQAGGARLRAMDSGTGSRSTDLIVECTQCGQKRRMTNAFNENAPSVLPQCRGRHAHLRTFEEGGCDHQVRPMLLGASNAWFAATRSVLAVPTSADASSIALDAAWPAIEDPEAPISEEGELKFAVARDPRLAKLKGFAVSDLWAAIVERRRGSAVTPEDADVLRPEWAVFTGSGKYIDSHDFRLGTPRPIPGFPGLGTVLAVDRIREVVALCGFTRIEGPDSGLASDVDTGPVYAPISKAKKLEWLPAAEVRGEGIFLRFPETTIDSWLDVVSGSNQIESLREAHHRWRRSRGQTDLNAGWPGARYVLIHSLSHALIRELALECGYSTASIRERIYAREQIGSAEAMAGVFLYTAAPDSEGTLGGLVALADPTEFGRLLGSAMERSRLCSSDPMCSGHLPNENETALHNAACHACLFLPETSCERANRYLDRNVLVSTLAGAGVHYPSRG